MIFDDLPLIFVCVLGYLLGSIPFGLLLTRSAGLGDIRDIGSGNIGATNVLRTGSKGLAAATLVLDGLKGAAAVLIARTLVWTLNTEYLVVDTSYGITYHPFVHIDRMTPDELIAREVVRIGFLRDKFLADLREARKILVFKQKGNLTEAAARALLRRLAAYGPNKLLYVVATDDPKRCGTVDLVDDGLARGFVARFGDYKNLPEHICYADWADICLQADTRLFVAPNGSFG